MAQEQEAAHETALMIDEEISTGVLIQDYFNAIERYCWSTDWRRFMKLNPRSEANLKQVHADLVSVVRRCAEITAISFIVIEGQRTMARQRQLVASGASQTLRSRHVIECNKSGFACAVDLAALVGNSIRWDWPLYAKLSIAMKLAAEDINIPIEWGGDWKNFKDGLHYQLPWTKYP